ncbi:hypothetical protein AAMO2058_000326800 [Amorphochlora amoebiformis]|uniref:Calcineurin-like phosphoesterase domain-containing protein n=1 Tax=Amorphochlora amoebiformis TaxID=1561963 RepID=A0A7S0H0V9_9EUKA|mmetsp:Transcript_33173/g.53270  ORF Transcript_33173/g.53270 Transcript_33173/m.53270 type:complete len:333 (+) Transcript_33173:68-1066(+)
MRSHLSLSFVAIVSGFSFLSIGDWGDVGAKTLNPHMGTYSPEFVLAIGDNFYDTGVTGIDDPQFKEKFEDTFTADSLQVPWYVCAGNHDYYGGSKGIQAEMEYTQKNERWHYPSLYFSKDLVGADGTKITLLSIDTWRINGGDTFVAFDPATNKSALRNITEVLTLHAQGAITDGTVKQLLKFFPEMDPSNPIKVSKDADQLQFIEDTLGNSSADWKIVMGHFPVHSATIFEHGDTKSLIKDLKPILENYGVDMYFSGHDHILQHIQLANVSYFGSGAGAREHRGVNPFYKGLKGHHEGTYGFMHHEGNKTSLKTTFVAQDGSEVYTYTITK